MAIIISGVKVDAIQIGQSATDSQNFQLSSNNDGTVKLARGAAGNLGDVLTVDAAGIVGLPVGQLRFPATQLPSADVNTLDDYKEGVWTSTLTGWGGSGITAAGSYVKVGRLVTFAINVQGTGITSAAGSSTAALPYVAASPSAISCVSGNENVSGTGVVRGGIAVLAVSFASTSAVHITGCYFV